MRILDRRSRLHRLQLSVHQLVERNRPTTVTVLDKPDVRGKPSRPSRRACPARPRASSSRATSRTPSSSTRWSRRRRRRSCTSRRSPTTTTRCTTRGRSCDTNIVGTYTVLEAARRHGVALPPHLHRRGATATSSSTTPSAVHRGHAVQPVEPVLLDEGRPRPARARVGALVRRAARRSRTARTTTARTSTSRSSSRGRSRTCSAACAPSSTAPGENVRDWIHADDHSSAVLTILEQGRHGRDLPHRRGRREEQQGRRRADPDRAPGQPADAYDLVTDRPGHDLRYAIDSTKLRTELGWEPRYGDFRRRPRGDDRLVPRQRVRGGRRRRTPPRRSTGPQARHDPLPHRRGERDAGARSPARASPGARCSPSAAPTST